MKAGVRMPRKRAGSVSPPPPKVLTPDEVLSQLAASGAPELRPAAALPLPWPPDRACSTLFRVLKTACRSVCVPAELVHSAHLLCPAPDAEQLVYVPLPAPPPAPLQ